MKYGQGTMWPKSNFQSIVLLLLGSELSSTTLPGKEEECWWSGCQPVHWYYRGCYPKDKYRPLKTVPCDSNNGHLFHCCPAFKHDPYRNSENDLENILAEPESGICSWYGGSDIPQGSPTASGEKFDRFAMTAAHKTLPFGTRIRVEHEKTGNTADVVINDRGPFIQGRILDLSSAAFAKLENRDKGLFRCSYTILPSQINKKFP